MNFKQGEEKVYHFRNDGAFVKVDPALDRQALGEYAQDPINEKELILFYKPNELIEEDDLLFGAP